MPESRALTIDRVSKRYGLGKFVIRDFSHTFHPGTATGLTGPNGSGKTTLLRLITTAAYPTKGSVFYGDINIHETPYAYLRHTGFAFDSSDLPQFANTEELLEVILRSRGKWNDESKAKIADILSMLDLDERRSNLIGTYSSGMMQKTLLAASVIAEPEIIMLDEPFRALDAKTRTALTGFLNRQKEKGATIIIASHLPEVIETLCDDTITFPLVSG